MQTIKATMPGVFYRRPSPDADPYATEGGIVNTGQTIALIEVMKTFNELKSEVDGKITKFLIEDGDEVEMGQDIAEVEA
ncbi:acetyl-CoA carboxylase [Saccharopolyspora sp. K220]|uniref:acetyl-CoA carboxylase n=1 Tax=Saccharopolyspora soli TaxID=2926618 RepID=UPI001F55C728|nr:acetyl-CoA carboxylase [Saccharopolyspora soli]MCI2422647.1 acetyl-CoA carboxylase [Saccharopolyspora soli]